MKKSAWAWIVGLGAAALGAVGIAVYESKKSAAAPSSPAAPSTPAPTLTHLNAGSTLQQGTSYVFGAIVPPGLASSAANLAAELATAGWSNVRVLWFGPTGESDPALSSMPVGVEVHKVATHTIVAATWAGLTGTPLPPNVDVWAVS